MSQWYQIQDNEWVLSSPNVPTMDVVYIYSGLGLLEDTSISEGRGTTKPFQMMGNPNVTANNIVKYFKNHVNLIIQSLRLDMETLSFLDRLISSQLFPNMSERSVEEFRFICWIERNSIV